MNQKQVWTLLIGAAVGAVAAVAMPDRAYESVIAFPMSDPSASTVVSAHPIYNVKIIAVTVVWLVTLGTTFILRTPKTPPPNPQ